MISSKSTDHIELTMAQPDKGFYFQGGKFPDFWVANTIVRVVNILGVVFLSGENEKKCGGI